MSWQRRVPEENSMLTTSASVKRRLSSEHLQSQNYRGMTTTCCPGSNRSFWWGFAPVITDWTVICTVNWSWHPRQLAPVVEKSRPWSMFYKDAPFTKPQEKTCGLSALPWRPNSTAASRSWRRRHHSSPEWPWSCRLRTPRRRRRRRRRSVSFIFSLSSTQDGIVELEKAHTRSAPSLSSLPKVALDTVPIFVWLNTDRSRPCVMVGVVLSVLFSL